MPSSHRLNTHATSGPAAIAAAHLSAARATRVHLSPAGAKRRTGQTAAPPHLRRIPIQGQTAALLAGLRRNLTQGQAPLARFDGWGYEYEKIAPHGRQTSSVAPSVPLRHPRGLGLGDRWGGSHTAVPFRSDRHGGRAGQTTAAYRPAETHGRTGGSDREEKERSVPGNTEGRRIRESGGGARLEVKFSERRETNFTNLINMSPGMHRASGHHTREFSISADLHDRTET